MNVFNLIFKLLYYFIYLKELSIIFKITIKTVYKYIILKKVLRIKYKRLIFLFIK